MPSRLWFRLASIVASTMVIIIAYILVPDNAWNKPVIISAVFLSMASGFLFYAPFSISSKNPNSDAVRMASLGPTGMLTVLTLILTVGAFILALNGKDSFSYAANVFTICTFVIFWIMLKASADVIEKVGESYAITSKHVIWQNEVQSLKNISTDQSIKKLLNSVSEKLRYAASDVPGGSPQDSLIDGMITDIGNNLTSDSNCNIQTQLSKLSVLIDQREIYLRSVRSKV